ncbi:MAG TPA: signal peptidase II [Acidimicrobiales bacterium]|nr:signal peptidase II [Acidimicrobiales bacterium]
MIPVGVPVGARRRRRPALVPVAAVLAAVVALDQVTKSLALARLGDGPVEVFWTLRFNLSFNSGLAFSQGRGLTPLITVAAVAVVVILVLVARKARTLPVQVALGLLLGGAVGNLTDRLLRDHGGAVVDFIDLQWWPIFNVADMAITVGALLLVVAGAREPAPGSATGDAGAGH